MAAALCGCLAGCSTGGGVSKEDSVGNLIDKAAKESTGSDMSTPPPKSSPGEPSSKRGGGL